MLRGGLRNANLYGGILDEATFGCPIIPTIQKSLTVAVPVGTVWSILENPTLYVQGLEPRKVSFEITPPGPISVGQRIHVTARAGGRKVEVFSEITEVVPGRRIVETLVPNNFFRNMTKTHMLEPCPEGTLLKISLDYEPRGSREKVIDLLFVRRAMEKDYATRLLKVKNLTESQAVVP